MSTLAKKDIYVNIQVKTLLSSRARTIQSMSAQSFAPIVRLCAAAPWLVLTSFGFQITDLNDCFLEQLSMSIIENSTATTIKYSFSFAESLWKIAA